jgi:hypothetical protein
MLYRSEYITVTFFFVLIFMGSSFVLPLLVLSVSDFHLVILETSALLVYRLKIVLPLDVQQLRIRYAANQNRRKMLPVAWALTFFLFCELQFKFISLVCNVFVNILYLYIINVSNCLNNFV